MPDYMFSFVVPGISPQRAGAISQRIEQKLGEDSVTVTSKNTARLTRSFRVVSVDVTTREAFDETIEAADEQAAHDQVTTADRVVASVDEVTV
jgi:GGDEF domain-containing protein